MGLLTEEQKENARHKANIRHDKWRLRANKKIPDLTNRVFNLRGKMYSGCGFHYDIERQLGWVIMNLNRTDREALEPINQIMLETLTTSLFKDIALIEREIKHKGV